VIFITFIVNGEDALVQAEPELPLAWAKRRALILSRNDRSRPESEWELRYETGQLVENDLLAGAVAGMNLYLTLRVAAGGSCRVCAYYDARLCG
jgi:hypothetical protein